MKRIKLHGRSVDFIVCSIYLVLAVIIFRNTGLEGMFSKTDLDLPFYPIETFYTRTFAWGDKIFFGASGAEYDIPHIWPTYIFFYVLNVFGLSSGMAQRIIYVLIFATLGWGMYFLMSSVILPYFKNVRERQLGAFLTALFYMFNPYTFFSLEVQHYDFLMVLAFFPIFLAFYMQGRNAFMRSDKNYVKYVLFLGFSSTILLPANYAITYALVFFFIWFFIFEGIMFLRSEGIRGFKRFAEYSMCCLAVVVLLNTWWILNLAWALFETNGFASTLSAKDAYGLLKATSNIGIIDALRLQPCIIRTQIYPRFPFNPQWDVIFTSPLFTILGTSIFLLALGCLISGEKRNKYVIFWTMTFILFFPLYTGLNPPLGQVFWWMWNNIPFFHLFRNPDKFMTVIVTSFTVIFGISVALAYTKIEAKNFFAKPKLKQIFCFVAITLLVSGIFINSYPLLSGDLEGELEPIRIPKNYEESKEWLDAQEQPYRIMIVPFDSLLEAYSWGPKYDTLPVPYKTYNQPIVYYHPREKAAGLPEGTVTLSEFFYKYSESGSGRLAELLSLMNVKYVLVRDDLIQRLPRFEYRDGQWYEVDQREKTDASWYETLFGNQEHLREVARFGNLSFYENEINTPIIYTANKSIYSNESFANALSMLLEIPDFSILHSAIVSGQSLKDDLFPTESTTFLAKGEKTSAENWKVEIPSEGVYELFGKKLGIEGNWFPLTGTQTNWKEYLSGGSYGALTVANDSINLSANDNWYIYRREAEYSVSDLRYLSVDYRSTGNWYIWIDWLDTEGVDHRTYIAFPKSESESLKTVDLLLYLEKASDKIPDFMHHIELNPDPQSEVFIGRNFGISRVNRFSVIGTQTDWKEYLSGGSFGTLSVTDAGIALSANENWYVYRRELSCSLENFRYLIFNFRGTGDWYIWIDWFDTEGGEYRTPILFTGSESESLGVVDLVAYLNKTSGKTAQTINRVELNPDPLSEVHLGDMIISEEIPATTKLSVQSLTKGTNIIDTNVKLLDLIAIKSADTKNPVIQFEKRSPVEYHVKVSEAGEPFVLVFSETFSTGWKAYFGDMNWLGTFFTAPISDEYHFSVNGFANAWYINKAGTYNITLYYLPQELFYIGSAISLATVILCIVYISKNRIKTTYKRARLHVQHGKNTQ